MNKKGFFPEIPLMDVPAAASATPVHYGATDFVVTLEETDKKDYQAYLTVLEENGFVKYVDNGEGLDHAVFCATYTKDNLVVTVTYAKNIRKTYISAAFDLPLSEHLFYKNEYVADNKEGAKTKLHMMEMWQFGNGFVFQLKNGHFIISDGGLETDLPYVLDYLESLTPEGEKPVVEAWIFSHGHSDHGGIMTGVMRNRPQAQRLYVEGIYYSEPNDRVKTMDPGAYHVVSRILGASKIFRTTKGERPNVYRPQTGQRYYFNDITMDILFAQEQLPREEYDGDFNDSSTICMFNIEGQKLLFSGDAHRGGLGFVKDNYSQEYLNLTVFTLNHHGFNTWDDFTYYAKIQTTLFTVRGDTPVRRARENEHIKEMSQEWFNWGDGTKILTFPYEVGSYESLPNKEWIYNKGEIRATQPNIYVYPKKYFNKVKAVIFDCDGTLVDSERIYMKTWEIVGKEMGFEIPEDLLYRTRGTSDSVGRQMYLEVMGKDFPLDEISKRRAVLNEELFYQTENVLRPGVLELLKWLKEHDILMAVASAKTWKMTTDHLRHAGIVDYFDTIAGGNMVKRNKPNPDIFLKAAELIHVPREQCLVVGDSVFDIMAANAAGMRGVLIPDLATVTDEMRLRSWAMADQLDEIISIIQTENEM